MIAEGWPSTPKSSNIRNSRSASAADRHGADALLYSHCSSTMFRTHSHGSARLRTPSARCQIGS